MEVLDLKNKTLDSLLNYLDDIGASVDETIDFFEGLASREYVDREVVELAKKYRHSKMLTILVCLLCTLIVVLVCTID